MPSLHPIHRRYYAEDLVRRRRAGEARRYAASQRQGRIDPNPHQIDAVMFALQRIPEGGCVLADEVGLGKTIEAGLVIAQLLAEGAERILIILPRALVGQWQDELFTLFGISAFEASEPRTDTNGPGVFLAGREWAGGPRGSEKLGDGPAFDLCVIDEAHELFASIHRRFDGLGTYQEEHKDAQTAHRVRKLLGPSPVLLLTATPMQNSLLELWGLVQYVERSGTLLGLRPTFRKLFCEDTAGRRIVPEQSPDLRRRLASVVHRTLRRQAQEFLEKPFVGRSARLFEYRMEPDERSLYDDVTAYLLRPTLYAFRGRSRQLLLIGFHRRMASSTAALAASLHQVANRLRKLVRGLEQDDATELSADFLADLEDEDDTRPAVTEETSPAPKPTDLRNELAEVEDFIRRAQDLPHDSKAQSLVTAVEAIGKRESGSHKVVIFTESLTTQSYLRDLLVESAGLREDEITLFSGANGHPRARDALARWQGQIGNGLPAHSRPSPNIAVRLALVHEFKTRSRVFISTEAGAKGLNLQFCDTIVNYDLPWNPQRIEQRIGRCHRYGQTRDVTVINFLAKDNEAQRLTFDILSQKLELFGTVLGMTDEVLHESSEDGTAELGMSLGPDFEAEIRRIWDRARSVQEVEVELRRLRDSVDERRRSLEDVREHTIGLIESRLDESVRAVFRQIRKELPATLAELDGDLERVATAYLTAIGAQHTLHADNGRRVIEVPGSEALPALLAEGLRVGLGHSSSLEEMESLHGRHPLIKAALRESQHSGTGDFRLRFVLADDSSPVLKAHRGARGRLALTKVSYSGFESEDRLVVTAIFEDSEVLRPAEAARELLRLPCEDLSDKEPPCLLTKGDLDEVVDEEMFLDQSDAARREQDRFELALDQLNQFMDDRSLILRRELTDVAAALEQAETTRDGALGAEARQAAQERVLRYEERVQAIEADLGKVDSRADAVYEKWRNHAHARRYKPPEPERLFSAEFVLE